jgi:integrase/recombinase XerD
VPPITPDELSRAFLLERFDEFLTLEQGSSARTNEAYGRDLARLATWASIKGVATAGDLGPGHLREFVYHLKDLGLAPSSIRRGISAIRTWYRFLMTEGVVTKDPSEQLETPRKWRVLPEVLTAAEVERIIGAVSLDEPLAFRDRAMLELAYGAGLRVSEWIGVGTKDVLLDELVVRVHGKGGKERLVPVGSHASGAVAMYLRELRPRLERGQGAGKLFLNAHGRPLSRMGAWGTASRLIYLRAARTCGRCRRCSGTPTSRRRRSIRTSTASTCAKCTGSSIHGGEMPMRPGEGAACC